MYYGLTQSAPSCPCMTLLHTIQGYRIHSCKFQDQSSPIKWGTTSLEVWDQFFVLQQYIWFSHPAATVLAFSTTKIFNIYKNK